MVKPKPLGPLLTMMGALRVLIKGDRSLHKNFKKCMNETLDSTYSGAAVSYFVVSFDLNIKMYTYRQGEASRELAVLDPPGL